MRRQAILCSLFLLFFFPIAWGQLAISPSEFHVEIVGGENLSKNLTIEWGGRTPVVAYLSYEVSQANGFYTGKELWIDFSENPVILEPNKPKTIEFRVHSLPNIQPDTYFITIEAKVNLERREIIRKEVRIEYRNVTVNATMPAKPNATAENLETLYHYYSNLSQKLLTKLRVLESEKSTYEQLINYLKERLGATNATVEELGQKIELLAKERQELERRWLLSMAVLAFFLVLSSMAFLAKLKRKNRQIGKLLVAFRKRE